MTLATQPTIALLSLASDPARHSSTSPWRALPAALTQLGWQVDCFTRRTHAEQPGVEWLGPYCRSIRLTAETAALHSQVAEWARALHAFQLKDSTPCPLIHTLDDLSARVGAWLQAQVGWRWLHTPSSLAGEAELSQQADQSLVWRAEEATPPFSRRAAARAALGLLPGQAVLLCDASRALPDLELLVAALAAYASRSEAADWRCLAIAPAAVALQQVSSDSSHRPEGWRAEAPTANLERLAAWLARTAARFDLPADFLPRWQWLPPSQRDLAYAAADLSFIPSVTADLEVALLAALDADLPAIAPDTPASRFTLVPGTAGQLVPPGDASAMAEAIANLLGDEVNRWRHQRQRAAQSLERGWSRTAAHLSYLYRQHLAAHLGAELDLSAVYHLPLPAVSLQRQDNRYSYTA